MKPFVMFIVICLFCSFLSTAVHARELQDPDLKDPTGLKSYCSGLVGNSLAFAFASIRRQPHRAG